jgi:hypothetical protein
VETLLLGVTVLVSFVLALSGAAKLIDHQGTADALTSLRIPGAGAHGAIAWALPAGELLVALGLWLPWSAAALTAAVAAVCVFTVFTGVIARALRFDEPVTCACFGTLGSPAVSRRTVVRNLVLLVTAGLAGVATGSGVLPGAALVTDPVRVTATSATVLLSAAITWLVLAPGPPTRADGDAAEAAVGEYVASPIPYGQVRGGDDALVTLRELPASQAVLLVFLSPGCGPCRRVLESLPSHRAQVSPAVRIDIVASGTTDWLAGDATSGSSGGNGGEVWDDPDRNAARVFGISGRPAAVLLGADGTVAGGPVTGEGEVTALIDEMAGQLREAGLV